MRCSQVCYVVLELRVKLLGGFSSPIKICGSEWQLLETAL